MHENTKTWMNGAADRTIKAALMTAEQLTAKGEALDSRNIEKLHWCWETIEAVKSACFISKQIDAHEAANAPMGVEDLAKMLQKLEAKLGVADPVK